MFIYVVEREFNGVAKYIDKYNCHGNCKRCELRFSCFTKEWRTLRSQDDFGVLYEQSELPHIPVHLAYCCKLVCGKTWDALAQAYVSEV